MKGKKTKRLTAAMLTAVMAVSAAPITGSVTDIFGGNAITASAAGYEKYTGLATRVTDEDGNTYSVFKSSFEYDEKLQKYKAPCYLREDNTNTAYIRLGRIYVTDDIESPKATGSFIDDESYKTDERFKGVADDNFGWPHEDLELADNTPGTYFYCIYDGQVWFTNKEKDRLWRYDDNGDRVYYRQNNSYSSSPRIYYGYEEFKIDKNSGLEKFNDSESGYAILNAFSETQLQAGVDSAPANPEDNLINTHINFVINDDITFTKGIDITDGRNVEIINADRNKKVFGGDSVNIFRIGEGSNVVLREFVLSNGYAKDGGAVYNEGDLYMYGMAIMDSKAVSGGAIYNAKNANLKMFTTERRAVYIGNCEANYGGGIYNEGVAYIDAGSYGLKIEIADCSVTRNGGAIFNNGELHVYGSHTKIYRNKATTPNDESSENQGGGIYNSGLAYVHNAQISNNHADNGGGGIYNSSELHLDGAKITGNYATEKGAGVYASAKVCLDGALNITGNKIVDNSVNQTQKIKDSNIYIDTYASNGVVNKTYLLIEDPDNTGTGIHGSAMGVTIADGVRDFTTNYSKIHEGVDPSTYFSSDDPDYDVIWNKKQTEATLGQQKVERLAGTTLSLEGEICINFHMQLEDSILKDKSAYMEFAVPTGNEGEYEIRKVMVSDATEYKNAGQTYYTFKCRVPAKMMSSVVRAQLVYNEGLKKGKDYTYSIKDYAQSIIDNDNDIEEYEKATPMMEAMLNYGAYAQVAFNYNTDNLANEYCEKKPDIDAAVSALKKWDYKNYKKENLPENITYVDSTLELDSMVNLRMYFNSWDEINAELTSYGVTRKSGGTGDYLKYITFDNIKPNEYDQILDVKINGDYSIKYCPLTSCYNVLTKNFAESKKNVAAALYEYYVAVKDYALSVTANA